LDPGQNQYWDPDKDPKHWINDSEGGTIALPKRYRMAEVARTLQFVGHPGKEFQEASLIRVKNFPSCKM